MEEIKLSDDVIEPIMGFNHECLTKEQEFGNHEVDRFIQKAQLKAKYFWKILEWIEYDRFKNVEYLAKGGFGITYKTIWKDGYIVRWDSKNNRWERL
ncbi:kinase-like domain-containing protein [Rhizophagus clarus]|uniref:Kinase-like domain-containing protein n=1 Tax=Rhizophagus clarus TaxID=94130 RepID=A0A8H3QVB6_9GLOM|nr:kinase-like domain-containing protein [Rhizophagus clarus]